MTDDNPTPLPHEYQHEVYGSPKCSCGFRSDDEKRLIEHLDYYHLAALQERLEAAERERNYLRSVVEQLHRDAHDALGETRED